MSARSPARSRWGVALACAVLAASAVCISLYRALDAHDVPRASVGLDVVTQLHHNLELMKVNERAWRVAFLGDSTVVAYPQEHQLPKRLSEATKRQARGRPPIRIYPLAAMGMTPFDFYFLADKIVEASPDQIIVPFNLASFSESWRDRFPRTELAGWVSPSRIPEVLTQPVAYIGLTTDRLLAYQVTARSLGLERWRFSQAAQARLEKGRLALELWGSSWQRPNPVATFRRNYWSYAGARLLLPKQNRYNSSGMEMHHGGAFAGQTPSNAVIHIFGEALRIFQEANIPVLVYVVPMNHEHSRTVGVFDAAGLRQTLESVSDTAHRHGAEILDLHRLFPDRGFSDAPGHFTYDAAADGGIDGPRIVARQLAPRIVERARKSLGKPR
jgi:hypothetical protein